MRRLRPISFLLALSFAKQSLAQDLPPFVTQLIEDYQSIEAGASPGEIWRYEFRDATVYYLPRSHLCCDIPSVLYDSEGQIVCLPDGGITGRGDGRCTDFITRRSNGVRVWPPAEAASTTGLIAQGDCNEQDERCLRLTGVRYALRLPDGFGRAPDCAEALVCVAENLSLRHDDFVAILDLVSPQIRPEWTNVRMDEVLTMSLILVTAESDRMRGGEREWMDGGKFLVEQEPPGSGWSILRQRIYHIDLVPSRLADDEAVTEP